MLKLTIRTDNAAFEDLEMEVGRILRRVADELQPDGLYHTLFDANGNDVGRYRLTSPESSWLDEKDAEDARLRSGRYR